MSADPRQLTLGLEAPAVTTSEDLRQRLERAFGAAVQKLVLTSNRSRIASAKQSKNGWELRLHRCFLSADDVTLPAIATFFTASPGPTRRRALAQLREHYAAHGGDPKVPRPKLRVVGEHHDLEILRDRIDLEYFDDRLNLAITWGRSGSSRKKRRGGYSIRLGSYEESQRLVRIHPVLDRREVPEIVVASVVYHEMLHAAVPPESMVTRHGERRRRVHSPEFRRREKLFEHFEAAETWLERNGERLATWRAQT